MTPSQNEPAQTIASASAPEPSPDLMGPPMIVAERALFSWLGNKHLSLSGLIFIALNSIGIIYPEYQGKTDALAKLAAGYFAGTAIGQSKS